MEFVTCMQNCQHRKAVLSYLVLSTCLRYWVIIKKTWTLRKLDIQETIRCAVKPLLRRQEVTVVVNGGIVNDLVLNIQALDSSCDLVTKQ